MLITPFFKMVNSSTTKLDSPQFGIVDFKILSPEDAFEMWQKYFVCLQITPEGAKEYLSDLNSNELVALIKSRKNIEEVKAIAKVKNTKAVKEAVAFMIEKLS